MKKAFYPGLKKILFPLQKAREFLDTSRPARALFGSTRGTTTGKNGDLVEFFKQVSLFTDLSSGDLRWLARIVHERVYRDGEVIFEQGTPGAALYLLRSGMVEIIRKKGNAEEIPLAILEPPASFEELAAVGAEVVHWASARARGPVSLVAVGYSDLDALSHNLPRPANKVIKRLAQVMAVQLRALLEAEYFGEERSVNGDPPQ